MSSLRRLSSYLSGARAGLIAATLCMLILAATSAFYAFLAGPGLKFMFSGNLTDVLFGSDGELRTLWTWFPTSWLDRLQSLEAKAALLFLPLLLVATAILKGAAQTGQFYLLGRISQSILLRLRHAAFRS